MRHTPTQSPTVAVSGILAGFILGAKRPTRPTSRDEARAGQANVNTPGRRKRVSLSPCGKAACGSTEAWTTPCPVRPGSPVHSGDFLCWARLWRPPITPGPEPPFRHFDNDEAVATAAGNWDRNQPRAQRHRRHLCMLGAKPRMLMFRPRLFLFLQRTEKRKDQWTAARCIICGRAPKTALKLVR